MKKYAIHILPGGGFGDMICSLPVIDFIIEKFGHIARIDIGEVKSVKNYEAIIGPNRRAKLGNIYAEMLGPKAISLYDAWLSINEVTTIAFKDKGLSQEMGFFEPNAKTWVERINSLGVYHKCSSDRCSHVNALFPFTNNQMAHHGVKLGLKRWSMPQWCIGMPEPYAAPKLENISHETKFNLPPKFVTINDSWNAVEGENRPTKAYKANDWHNLVYLLKKNKIPVVQIGAAANGNAYDVDVQLRGQTTLAESFEILSRSTCHIDIEGGLVHAASTLGTKCIVLFGPTPSDFFGYSQNINLTHGSCQGCWFLKPRWMEECLTQTDASCMTHSPHEILNHVKAII